MKCLRIRGSSTTLCAAQKLRGGDVIFVTTSGQCTRVDAKGKEGKSFPVSRMLSVLGSLEVLPNNHVARHAAGQRCRV